MNYSSSAWGFLNLKHDATMISEPVVFLFVYHHDEISKGLEKTTMVAP